LGRLKLQKGDELFCVEMGGQLRLRAYTQDDEKLMAAARANARKYRKALRAMAKS
jgi:hypothetical protein